MHDYYLKFVERGVGAEEAWVDVGRPEDSSGIRTAWRRW